ncbi:staygreen protein [Aquisalibacillus elongatus]|uniref:Staygreen protein n=1 Tax=Aquisalibacillus elongatus TaxID=485577 RepID=A0A3N5BN01_9BACI|nr:staygreen family protein [Aquisalibacillus elongatus]RPF51078.1 staygreen protein [Aquisalibacillus elongatus]
MSRLDPEQLYVEYRDGVTPYEPLLNRRHTLTHSDETGELFLTVGLSYAYDLFNEMRDEVIGEWIDQADGCFYHVYLYVGGPFSEEVASIRNDIFRRELPLALEAIRYGDRGIFNLHPSLDSCQIITHFMSVYPQFNKIENWGTFDDYNILLSQ